jgi:hypothetical protein
MPKIIIINDEPDYEPEDTLSDWKQVADYFPSNLRDRLLSLQGIED